MKGLDKSALAWFLVLVAFIAFITGWCMWQILSAWTEPTHDAVWPQVEVPPCTLYEDGSYVCLNGDTGCLPGEPCQG